MNPAESVGAGIRRVFVEAEIGDEVHVYLFGSVITDVSGADDIDVLVLYSTPEQAHAAREVLVEVSEPKPIDLILLTFDEEATYDFVRTTNAARVFP